MSADQILGLLSGIICLFALVPYIRSILRKKTIPHPFTWLMWSVLGLVTFATYKAVGAHDTLPLAIANAVDPIVILFLSLHHWRGHFSRFDYVCLALSFVAVIIFIVSRQAAVALSLNLAADFLAALPTIRKVYHAPHSEDLATWLLLSLGASLSIFALSSRTYGVTVFPLYLTALAIVLSLLIIFRRLKKAQ